MDSNSEIEVFVNCEVYHILSDWVKLNLNNDMIFNIGANRIEIIIRGSKYKMVLIDAGRKLSQTKYLEQIKIHLTEYKKKSYPELPDGVYSRPCGSVAHIPCH